MTLSAAVEAFVRLVLHRSSTLSLATLSSHIDTALDLVLLDYAGNIDSAQVPLFLLMYILHDVM